MLASGALPLGIAVRLARHRDPITLAPVLIGRKRRLAPLVGALIGVSLWVGAYALELLLDDYRVSVWLHRLVFVAIALIPPAVLLTALEATENRLPRMGALLVPVPALTIILTLTNDYQALMWAPGPLVPVGALSPIDTVRGPWFLVHTAFSYACLALAFARLAYHYVHDRRSFSDAATVLAAFLAPWLANALHVFFRVGDAVDVTPAGFIVTGALIYRIVRRDLLADILFPAARATVLELLGDAVMVLDERLRILDANRAALALLTDLEANFEGLSRPSLADCWPALAALVAEDDPNGREVTLQSAAGSPRSLELRVTRLDAQPRIGVVRAVALRDVTDRQLVERELYRRAHYDSLTGLPNRVHLLDRLSVALASARQENHHLAVLLLDLDRFKLVNDVDGHAAGDALLRDVADQLMKSLRGSDVVARICSDNQQAHLGRLGGDEFAVVLPRIASTQDAGDVAARLVKAIEHPFEGPDGGSRTSTTVSVGIAVFPDDGQEAETLLKRADVALYQAKEWGGNRYEYSNSRLARIAERRAAIDRELRGAIASGQLCLDYQPKVRLRVEGVAGMEALLRWSHPELGNVSPAEFIPIAERTGLILSLGDWVIERAGRQIRSWRDAGLSVPRVAVNVSSLQLRNPDFLDHFTGTLRRYDLGPECMEIELTERTLLTNDESTFVALRDLRAIGTRIALDDFGTGYSALACLNRFEIDTLKIDRSFLEAIDTNERALGIVASVITLAHSFEMNVVAEGVERAQTADILRRLGCDEAQGLLYSEPLTASEIADFLRCETDPMLPKRKPQLEA